ncbi:sugar ABC transporter ATP-binding protein [Rhizobium bangladeshense]|uniref:sugar ABC transporter ATP-binding protein n=1 Tax=Rhizobium bangladeshense TaxID=1138189 RepID=UPI001A989E13|nr:sugar ABC transporter ATP-binding protein [Rhizobium bangladeshense]MBX4870410.1 sugar ABC transporter ATP-binding protein [Rhizobium bangladeshense]MBX4935954.1 sugar ABC transporter ATP-binding protein [Rhizobium bangladeshense]QSY92406.1 sugar ABC transporter ATP-binding protein [Rhizobium bangladeshense]
MPLLHIENITRSFGSTRALAGADLSIERGEIVALMGANGAGKSTLVKILSGVLAAGGGTIQLDGRPFAPRSPAEAAKAGVVTVHQSTDLVGAAGLTVADALLLNRFADSSTPFFVSRTGIRRAAQAMLDAAGFSLSLDRDFGELTSADRQLVAIARALANRADLLILDEPTASLSGEESRRLFDILLRLRKRGLSILYISHRTADLETIADRALVMRGGRVIGSFSRPIDFSSAIETMIGRKLEAARPDARPATGPAIFEMRDVSLLSSGTTFDLSVHEGEVVAVTGVLGAGKSRLLQAIFGVTALGRGAMFLDGRPYRPKSPAEAIAAGVAMAAEDRHRSSLMPPAWPGHSLSATISLPHLAKWYPHGFLFGGRERREAEQAMARLGIKAAGPLASIWSLSGGNQQKAVIGRWEAEPSRLLLLDEPFQGVDVGARHDIIRAIRARTDRATLIATSDPEEAYEVADRILVIDRHVLRSPASGIATPAAIQGISA